MDLDQARIQELIDRPGESLAVEIKSWLDPSSAEGQSKIVRAVLALRNHGGGYLVIGFDDKTLEPIHQGAPADARAEFHPDIIQGLVNRYASEPFEVGVGLGTSEGREFPVICVPTGIRTPVAAKADLFVDDKKPISTNDVYVRTLRSNNTPSTAKASWKDYGPLVDVCMDNREADIGRFIRRHLTSVTAPAVLQQLASAVGLPPLSEAPIDQRLRDLLDAGEERFQQLVAEKAIEIPRVGWWEVALIIEGEVPEHSMNISLLNLLDSSNPDLTGWPIWVDSRSFADRTEHPYVVESRWETLIVDLEGFPSNVDFHWKDPLGRFYLRWALQDDLSNSPQSPAPNTAFDFGLPIVRATEAITVGLAFAKAMGCKPETCALQFAFRWSGLKGRELNSWAQPRRFIRGGRHAYQDRVTVFQRVALDTPLSAIGGMLAYTLKPLYELFDGFELDLSIIEDLSTRLIERRF